MKKLLIPTLLFLAVAGFGQTQINTNQIKDGAVTFPKLGSGVIADAINNGTTTSAPTQNAVFDAIAAIINQVSVSTAGGTITFDCNNQVMRMFVGSASFSAPKTLALSNTTNTLVINFKLNLTTAAVLTFPSDWTMTDLSWNGTTWTPPQDGRYEFGASWDSVNSLWDVKVKGPAVN